MSTPFVGTIAYEGIVSRDGRQVPPGALVLPRPVTVWRMSTPGLDLGRLDRIERGMSGAVIGYGHVAAGALDQPMPCGVGLSNGPVLMLDGTVHFDGPALISELMLYDDGLGVPAWPGCHIAGLPRQLTT